MSLSVTPLYIAIFTIFYLILALRVIYLRNLFRVGLGDGGRDPLRKAIRVHGNFNEYVPLSLIILIVLEVQGSHSYLLHGMGSILVFSRILHAIGVMNFTGTSLGRFLGSCLNYISMLVGAIILISQLCS